MTPLEMFMVEFHVPLCVMIILEKKKRLELVQLTIERITSIEENLEETQSTHMSYIDNLKNYLVFEFVDYVILKVCLLSYNEIWKKKTKSLVYKTIRNIRKVCVLVY